MKIIYLFFVLLIPFSSVFAQSTFMPYDYELSIDEHTFNIEYDVNADVLAMAIDQELDSLLIGLDNTQNSSFVIILDNKLISAENNDFLILVNGIETDYKFVPYDEKFSLEFFVPEFTEEVEIVGTHVIPEFPLGVVLVFVVMITMITVITKSKSFLRL